MRPSLQFQGSAASGVDGHPELRLEREKGTLPLYGIPGSYVSSCAQPLHPMITKIFSYQLAVESKLIQVWLSNNGCFRPDFQEPVYFSAVLSTHGLPL